MASHGQMDRLRCYRVVKRHRGEPGHTRDTRAHTVSQSVSYFTVPPRAHPSTGSQSGSATPGLTQVPSTRSRGLLNCRK